jgi:hypothetical protein
MTCGFEPASCVAVRLLVARTIERAADEGAFVLDFLRGREPYKYEWGAVDRPAAIYQPRRECGSFDCR